MHNRHELAHAILAPKACFQIHGTGYNSCRKKNNVSLITAGRSIMGVSCGIINNPCVFVCSLIHQLTPVPLGGGARGEQHVVLRTCTCTCIDFDPSSAINSSPHIECTVVYMYRHSAATCRLLPQGDDVIRRMTTIDVLAAATAAQ